MIFLFSCCGKRIPGRIPPVDLFLDEIPVDWDPGGKSVENTPYSYAM
jgi:hypothetical protein